MTSRTVSNWTRLGAVVALGAVAVACGGDDDGGGGGGSFSIAALLAEIPLDVVEPGDPVYVSVGDLDEAAEQSGHPRPGAGASDDERFDWMLRITGVPESGSEVPELAQLSLPRGLSPDFLQFADEFADELGWNAFDVGRFIEYEAPPRNFGVFEVDVDEEALDAALGERVDGIWVVGPDEDHTQDLAGRTAARPFGEGVRLAWRNGRVALTRVTPAAVAWLAEERETLADEDDLRAVAEALDRAGVYWAALVRADLAALPEFSVAMTEEQLRALLEDTRDSMLDRFTAVGVGLSVVDEVAVATIAYAFVSDETAEGNAERLQALIEEGRSVRTDEPFGALFEIRSIEADGNVLVATLAVPDRPARVVASMLFNRDLLFVHR